MKRITSILRKVFIAVSGSFGIAVLTFLGLIIWGWIQFWNDLEPKISIAEYAQVVKLRKSSPSYAFLPDEVHSNAEQSSFYHIPGFLQGGDVVALRQQLDAERIAKLLADLKASGRMEVADLEPLAMEHCYPQYNLKKSRKNNMFEGMNTLPSGFRVFLFDTDLADVEKNWNHNFIAFTAVSVERGEIVYYVNDW